MNNEKTQSSFSLNRETDYSAIYEKEFKEDLIDANSQALIKGKFAAKDKDARVSRETRIEEIRCQMKKNMKQFALGSESYVSIANIWEENGY